MPVVKNMQGTSEEELVVDLRVPLAPESFTSTARINYIGAGLSGFGAILTIGFPAESDRNFVFGCAGSREEALIQDREMIGHDLRRVIVRAASEAKA
ncbi:MAG: hypothetical protein ACI9DF_004688 [Verrucomicrobiales bacterium]|jgi:hypothetical protein